MMTDIKKAGFYLLVLAAMPVRISAQLPPAIAQWPDCATAFTLTAANQNSVQYENTQIGCTTWAVQYSATSTGAGSSLSLEFQSAPDNNGAPGTWATYSGTLVSGANPAITVGPFQATFSGYAAWIRVRMLAANNVIIRGNLYGWRARPAAAAAISGTVNVANFPVTQAVNITNANVPVNLGDTGNIDAFSRLRVSEVETLFDSQQEYGLPPYVWGSLTATGGTVTFQPSRSSSFLDTTTTSGSRALIQTRAYLRYQPGKSQYVLLTGVFGNVSTNNVHRAGQFDEANGVFLQITSAGPSIVRRTSTSGAPVDNTVLQAAWNVDPMDGSGPSGVTLDFSRTQILVIDYQWLGVGRIRVGFDVDGVLYYAHYFQNANVLSVVYSQTANLPVRFENLNTGTAAAGSTLEAICASVMSEGGFQLESGVTRSSSTANTTYSVGTALVPVLCIRPALLFGGKTNRARIIVESLEVSTSAGARWTLNYYGAPTGGTFVQPVNSPVETDGADTAGTVRSTGITGGISVLQGYLGSGGGASRQSTGRSTANNLPITLGISGAGQGHVCVCVQSLTGTVSTTASINWREVY